jgi:hypothetical protein
MTRARAARALAVVALLAAARAARAEDARDGGATAAAPATSALRGAWSATTAGGRVLRGAWSAEVALATPDVALGAWSLVDERGATVMGGTWSARRAPKGWRGAWSARVGDSSRVVSGTWEADDRTLAGRKTFGDLLARTAETTVGGVWRMGRAHGNWWLMSGGRSGD